MKARQAVLLIAAGMSCILASLAATQVAVASFEFDDVSVAVSRVDGNPERGAGTHPDLIFFAKFPDEGAMVHDIVLALPPGFVGNPTTAGTCDPSVFAPPFSNRPECPVSSQIGTVTGRSGDLGTWREPVFNLSHGPEVPARFGFSHLGVNVYVDAEVRPDDYGVTSGSRGTIQTEFVHEAEVEIWGVPQDPAHNQFRKSPEFPEGGAPTEAKPRPFLRTPTSCTEDPVTFQPETDSWEEPGVFDLVPLTRDVEGSEFRFEGCEFLPFSPKLTASTTSPAADSPTGLAVDIDLPQAEGPYGRSTSDVRKVVTTFPRGMTVSDSSAAGLGSCSRAEIGIGTNDPPTCPESSKLGRVKIDTPLLEEQLQGDLYLAKQNNNPFGSLLGLYIAVKGPGFYLKLPARVDLDPETGQMTTTFTDTPQLPFEHLRLELSSGARAPLTTPRSCGTYAVKSEFFPWSGTAPVLDESTFTVSEGCAGGFSPKLRAGTKDPAAGVSSPFMLEVTRQDGEQNLAALDVTLPEGLLAKLKGVPVCGGAQAASGDCPAASQVGRTVVGAGSGPSPVYVPEAGKVPTAVYLAGPYKGAPYSLLVMVPAQAGPFDLGTVAVRSSIYIDPITTQVSVRSDRLPQILQGIPIAYRDVRVEVDRPDFMVNPTSCEGMKVTSTIAGSDGASATPSAPFRATGCDRLAFKPKLAVRFSGAPTHRGGHPALKAVLTMPKGNANIGRAQVTLPKTEILENAHIRTICTRVQYAADNCPKGSVYGFAKAWSPLLDRPLEGPVYLRSSNHTLPDLVASLDGQIHVDLDGRISSANKRLRTTFDFVPDAPVSKFVLKMQGGQKSLLVNTEELCKAKPRATAAFTGQNEKTSVSHPLVKVACGGKKK